jgi:hypothetical protein
MLRFSYTGWGWVSVASVFAATLFSLIAGFAIGGSNFGWLVAAVIMLAAGGLHHLLARALNSTVTPQGRVWHNRHTLNRMPMQVSGSITFFAFALLGLAVAIGQWTYAFVGVLFFVVALVALFFLMLGSPFSRRRVRR